jgi:hypothetical protein
MLAKIDMLVNNNLRLSLSLFLTEVADGLVGQSLSRSDIGNSGATPRGGHLFQSKSLL